jgi:hypothetical protein
MGKVKVDGGREVFAIDLPGVYSLEPRTEDERVTHDVLLGQMKDLPKPDAVLLILDSTNLARHLVLAAPVLSLGLPTLVILGLFFLFILPRFRDPLKAARPSNQTEAEENGAWPLPASSAELGMEVETPDGEFLEINDPSLIDFLRAGIEHSNGVSLLRSDRAMTDCAPLSLFSLQTVRQLERESGIPIDKRQFRANVYLDLSDSAGFLEDQFVGRSLRLGSKVLVSITKLDGRCMMITLNPDTAEKSPEVLKTVAQKHDGKAGLYAAVLSEGIVRKGDPVELLD